MSTWVALLQRGALVAVVAVVLRFILVLVIVLWSLRADEAGQRHARKVLRILRPGMLIRRPGPPAKLTVSGDGGEPPNQWPARADQARD